MSRDYWVNILGDDYRRLQVDADNRDNHWVSNTRAKLPVLEEILERTFEFRNSLYVREDSTAMQQIVSTIVFWLRKQGGLLRLWVIPCCHAFSMSTQPPTGVHKSGARLEAILSEAELEGEDAAETAVLRVILELGQMNPDKRMPTKGGRRWFAVPRFCFIADGELASQLRQVCCGDSPRLDPVYRTYTTGGTYKDVDTTSSHLPSASSHPCRHCGCSCGLRQPEKAAEAQEARSRSPSRTAEIESLTPVTWTPTLRRQETMAEGQAVQNPPTPQMELAGLPQELLEDPEYVAFSERFNSLSDPERMIIKMNMVQGLSKKIDAISHSLSSKNSQVEQIEEPPARVKIGKHTYDSRDHYLQVRKEKKAESEQRSRDRKKAEKLQIQAEEAAEKKKKRVARLLELVRQKALTNN
jgi:hypothetical protein